MKKNGKTTVYDFLYSCLLILLIIYFASAPSRNIGIRHIIVFGGSIITYCLALYKLRYTKWNKNNIKSFGIFLFIYILQFIISGEYSSGSVYAWLDFLSLYIIMTMESNRKISSNQLKQTMYTGGIIAIMLIMTYFSPSAYLFENGKSTGALALGMTNPNFTAMMITAVVYIIAINVGYIHNSKIKIVLSAILMLVLLYFIYLTEARSSLLVCVIAIIYIFLFKGIKLSPKIIVSIVVFPFVFAILYLLLSRYVSSDAEFLGKELFSGRENIYGAILMGSHSLSELLFGNFAKYKFANAHNGALSIMITIGIVGMIIVYYQFAKKLLSDNSKFNSDTSRIVLVCILSFFIQSCAEGTMFTGIFPGVGFIYIYYSMLSYDKEQNYE